MPVGTSLPMRVGREGAQAATALGGQWGGRWASSTGREQRVPLSTAGALGSLANLEELVLLTGDEIHQVAKRIIQQCQRLPCLPALSFFKILKDDSLAEICKLP